MYMYLSIVFLSHQLECKIQEGRVFLYFFSVLLFLYDQFIEQWLEYYEHWNICLMNEEINEIPSLFGPTNNILLHRWMVTFFNQFWTDACLVGFYFFIIIRLFVCVCVF